MCLQFHRQKDTMFWKVGEKSRQELEMLDPEADPSDPHTIDMVYAATVKG